MHLPFNAKLARLSTAISNDNCADKLGYSPVDLARLTGIYGLVKPNDPSLLIVVNGRYPYVTLTCKFNDDEVVAVRTIYFREREIANDFFYSRKGNDSGRKMLKSQARWAKRSDFNLLSCWAYRGPSQYGQCFGHYVWARLGWYPYLEDEVISIAASFSKIDVEFSTFEEALTTPARKKHWRENGHSWYGNFDTQAKSYSMNYLYSK